MLLTVLVQPRCARSTWRRCPILAKYPLGELLLGTTWHPLRGEFGFFPFIVGTLWVTVLAMVLAVPVCLLTAIYLSEYARPARAGHRPPDHRRPGRHPLGGLRPLRRHRDRAAGRTTSRPSPQKHLAPIPWLAPEATPPATASWPAGIVLAIMVFPFIISVAEEVLRGVPDRRPRGLARRWARRAGRRSST